jgi:hypothetical protein
VEQSRLMFWLSPAVVVVVVILAAAAAQAD